ncbi:MAG: glycosyltransferase family 2 protein [Candidatus Omnitrophota bacterium]|nr:glycosyltransferase family 2 protein [Candidatus Omnitrophota bacterium]
MAEKIKLGPLTENPLVSIIIPSFNQGKYLKKTIESIREQDYSPVEIVIIDGASTDSTIDVLHGYDSCEKITWVSEPDNGVADAVNKGFKLVRGQICAIQSSDDYYMPGAIRKIVSCFINDNELGLVYGDIIKTNEFDEEITKYRIKPFSIRSFLTVETWIPQPSAFFRTELISELKAWNSDYYCCDTEFWLRAVLRTKVLKIDEYISKRLMHAGQRDQNAAEISKSYREMIDRSGDIKKLPFWLRRAAECGKWMMSFRYNPTGSDWMATYYLWKAIASYPIVIRHIGLSKHLIPGYMPLMKGLSRIKQVIFKLPGRKQ